MTLKRLTLCLAALFLAATVPAAAQSLTGNIEGTIVDEQGGALPGVTVTALGKGAPRTTTTDAAGRYRFLGPRRRHLVPPGRADRVHHQAAGQRRRSASARA